MAAPMRRSVARFALVGAIPLIVFGVLQSGLFGVGPILPDDDRPFRVVLDPGHGGDELGATDFGLIERDSNLDMAKRVGALLTAAGVEVIYTRTDDGRAVRDGRTLSDYSAIFADLDARIELANRANADLFVSLHSNAFWDPSVRGVEVIYNPDRPFSARSSELAESIRMNVEAILQAHGYEPPPSVTRRDTEMTDAAGRTTPYLILGGERELTREEMDERGGDWEALGYGSRTSIETRATEMPGVIVELFYISNEEDAALLKDDSARHYMAEGVAAGILSTLKHQGA